MTEFEYELRPAYFTPFRFGNQGQYPGHSHIITTHLSSELGNSRKKDDTENVKITTHVLTINNVNSFICVKSPMA